MFLALNVIEIGISDFISWIRGQSYFECTQGKRPLDVYILDLVPDTLEEIMI